MPIRVMAVTASESEVSRSQVAFGAVVGEGHVGQAGEEQDRLLMALQSLPKIVGIGFSDPTALAVLSRRDGW